MPSDTEGLFSPSIDIGPYWWPGSDRRLSSVDPYAEEDIEDVGALDALFPSEVITTLSQSEYDDIIQKRTDLDQAYSRGQISAIDYSRDTANILKDAGIAFDPGSLDAFGASDQYGLLSKRINVVPDEIVDLDSRTTDDLTTDTTAPTIDIEGGITGGIAGPSDIGSMEQVVNMGSVYLGGGRFRDRETGDITYQQGAEDNPAYQVGEIYGYEGPPEMKGDEDVTDWFGIFSTVGTQGVLDELDRQGKSVQDLSTETGVSVGDIQTAIGTGGGLIGTGGLVGDTVVQTPTGTPGTVKQVTGGDGGTGGGTGGTGGGTGGTGGGTGDGDGDGGARNGLIMMLAQQAPITEQMFSRELFEPQMKELNNVAKALGMLQSIARPFV